MSKNFRRTIVLEIAGSIDDDNISPEDFLRSYSWNFKDYNDRKGDKCFLEISTKEGSGHITHIKKLEGSKNWQEAIAASGT
jgi:hypothetical protein